MTLMRSPSKTFEKQSDDFKYRYTAQQTWTRYRYTISLTMQLRVARQPKDAHLRCANSSAFYTAFMHFAVTQASCAPLHGRLYLL